MAVAGSLGSQALSLSAGPGAPATPGSHSPSQLSK